LHRAPHFHTSQPRKMQRNAKVGLFTKPSMPRALIVCS
jgi:hypothetical protein